MEIHENIYAVLPDKDPGDGMSFIIAKMNETTATKHAVVSQNRKKQKQNQQQQQELHADDFPSRPPPPRSSQRGGGGEEGAMHVKTDSEVRSMAPSSPPLSPATSPSRHPHSSSATAPPLLPLLRRPPPPRSRPQYRRRGGGSSRRGRSRARSGEAMAGARRRDRIEAIEEERVWGPGTGEEEEEDLLGFLGNKGFIRRRCYCFVFVARFIVLFSSFALILWGASRSQRPRITIKLDYWTGRISVDPAGCSAAEGVLCCQRLVLESHRLRLLLLLIKIEARAS
uniref:Uncharacterized protein n=1 Tax=Ananas comosus var. bracteatus TaxID=296719 RepID=A0A6V7Q646_ANACO|nr:unnamed protein product [Ananas comosus var. bracteatus]